MVPERCDTLSVIGYPHMSKKHGLGFPTNTLRMRTMASTFTTTRSDRTNMR